MSAQDNVLLEVDLGLAYFIAGILGALISDVFTNFQADLELVRELPIRLPTVVYFLSRVATLMSFSFTLRFYVAVNVNCNMILHIAQWAFAIGLSLSSLLFLFRVRAVYHGQKWVANFFVVMWLGVVAGTIVETQKGSDPKRLEPSGHCITTSNFKSFIISTTIIPLVNDSIIFCAITWKLVRNSHFEEISARTGIMVAIFGRHLPAFSKTLLRDGQVYFLATVLLSIVGIGLFCATSQTTARISVLFAFINMAVMHLMACKIYRKTRLRIHVTEPEPTSIDAIEFRINSFSNAHNMRLEPLRPKPLFNTHKGRSASDLEQQTKSDITERAEVDVVDGAYAV